MSSSHTAIDRFLSLTTLSVDQQQLQSALISEFNQLIKTLEPSEGVVA